MRDARVTYTFGDGSKANTSKWAVDTPGVAARLFFSFTMGNESTLESDHANSLYGYGSTLSTL